MTKGQKAVYTALKEYGPLPDQALVAIVQHVSNERMSSSGIRSRRSELADKGKVVSLKKRTVKMPSGRNASVWRVR